MQPLKLADATRSLGAPPDWDETTQGKCDTLDIRDSDGWMISGWQPTVEEIEKIRRGEPVWLHIKGSVHPIVGLSVGYQTE